MVDSIGYMAGLMQSQRRGYCVAGSPGGNYMLAFLATLAGAGAVIGVTALSSS
ncbi:MAG: hypothetical protein KA436_04610 [Oligoflexales bacterium]|nr:hypothetical protein [Oligoflexales bacterium]